LYRVQEALSKFSSTKHQNSESKKTHFSAHFVCFCELNAYGCNVIVMRTIWYSTISVDNSIEMSIAFFGTVHY